MLRSYKDGQQQNFNFKPVAPFSFYLSNSLEKSKLFSHLPFLSPSFVQARRVMKEILCGESKKKVLASIDTPSSTTKNQNKKKIQLRSIPFHPLSFRCHFIHCLESWCPLSWYIVQSLFISIYFILNKINHSFHAPSWTLQDSVIVNSPHNAPSWIGERFHLLL